MSTKKKGQSRQERERIREIRGALFGILSYDYSAAWLKRVRAMLTTAVEQIDEELLDRAAELKAEDVK